MVGAGATRCTSQRPGNAHHVISSATKLAVACPHHNPGNAVALQLSDNSKRRVSGDFQTTGYLWLREGHPDIKPLEALPVGVGHGSNPPTCKKLLNTETGNSNKQCCMGNSTFTCLTPNDDFITREDGLE